MSKIGLQSQSGIIVDLGKILQKKPVSYKLLGNALNLGVARTIRERSPQTFLVIRTGSNWAVDDNGFIQRYADEASAIADPFLHEGLCDLLEPPNEPVVQTAELAKLLNDRQVQYAGIMKARGYRVGAYNFSVGNPDYPLWPFLQDGIRASDYWLLLHEYGAPFMDSDPVNLALRHRKVLSLLAPDVRAKVRIGITECGIDLGSIGSAGGYRRMPQPPGGESPIDAFIRQLTWYDAELAKDPNVHFVHMFGYGMQEPWVGLGFDLAEVEEDRNKFLDWLQGGTVSSLATMPEDAHTPPPNPAPVTKPPVIIPHDPPAGTLDNLPQVRSDDDLRNLAYNTLKIPFNPDAALVKYARAHRLGVALAAESKYVDAAGVRWVWQPFVLGIARCKDGDFGNIQTVLW